MYRSVSSGILTLFLLIASGALRAADGSDEGKVTVDNEPKSSNMRSWQEEWRDEERERGWTWFGMGYEYRRAFSDSPGGSRSGGPSTGPGGNGAGGGGGNGGGGGGGGKRR